MRDNENPVLGERMSSRSTFRRVAPLVCIILSSCLMVAPRSGGTKFDESFVDGIQKGRTTTAELQQKLGKPLSVTRTSGGSETWTYSGWEGKPATIGSGYERMRTRVLTLTIRNGVVSDYSLTESDSGPRR